jgi:hypothetical protein
LQILDEQHDAYGRLASASSGASAQATANNDAIAGSASGAASATSDLAKNQDILNAAMQAGADPTTGMKDALKDMKDAADQADTAGQFLWATLEQIHGGVITGEQAARLEAAAFRDMAASARDVADAQAKADEKQQALTDAVNKYGADSPQAAQAGRDLAAANDAVSAASDKQQDSLVKAAQAGLAAAGAAYAHKAALGDLQGATDDARAATQAARDMFIAEQPEVDRLSGKAAELADKYHLIPDEVVTTFQQNGAETAKQQVKDLNDALDKIKDRTVHYTIVGDASNPGGYQVTAEGTMRATSSGLAVYAQGGHVSGPGTGTSDSILARLSNGEFIVNAAATAQNLPLLHAINNTPGFANGGQINATIIGDYAATDWTSLLSNAFNSFAQKLKVAPTGGNVNYSPTAGVEQWRQTVLQALALTGQPASLANVVLHQMQTESGGNPNAINNYDINAQRGDPSRGLLQTIMSTFNAYRLPGLSSNIYDPLSNIVAAIRYTISRYGGVAQGMQGHAYANGGIVPGYAPGDDTVPAWLSPGEAVISRMNGYKNKNKALLDTAASWFGGSVVYPDSLPPTGFGGGGGHVEIHNHTHVHHHTGNQGVNVEHMDASQPGQALAEIEYAFARARF